MQHAPKHRDGQLARSVQAAHLRLWLSLEDIRHKKQQQSLAHLIVGVGHMERHSRQGSTPHLQRYAAKVQVCLLKTV